MTDSPDKMTVTMTLTKEGLDSVEIENFIGVPRKRLYKAFHKIEKELKLYQIRAVQEQRKLDQRVPSPAQAPAQAQELPSAVQPESSVDSEPENPVPDWLENAEPQGDEPEEEHSDER